VQRPVTADACWVAEDPLPRRPRAASIPAAQRFESGEEAALAHDVVVALSPKLTHLQNNTGDDMVPLRQAWFTASSAPLVPRSSLSSPRALGAFGESSCLGSPVLGAYVMHRKLPGYLAAQWEMKAKTTEPLKELLSQDQQWPLQEMRAPHRERRRADPARRLYARPKLNFAMEAARTPRKAALD